MFNWKKWHKRAPDFQSLAPSRERKYRLGCSWQMADGSKAAASLVQYMNRPSKFTMRLTLARFSTKGRSAMSFQRRAPDLSNVKSFYVKAFVAVWFYFCRWVISEIIRNNGKSGHNFLLIQISDQWQWIYDHYMWRYKFKFNWISIITFLWLTIHSQDCRPLSKLIPTN